MLSLFIIAFFGSAVGALSSIGGGMILKPVLDVFGFLSPSGAMFLSSIAVIIMALTAYLRNVKQKVTMNRNVTRMLVIGALIGGFVGSQTFLANAENVALVQTSLLFTINVAVIVFVLCKKNLTTLYIENSLVRLFIGYVLGVASAFLGIGAIPLTAAVLYYFFSMDGLECERNTLFIAIISALAYVLSDLMAAGFTTVFAPDLLVLWCAGAVAGTIFGIEVYYKVPEELDAKITISALGLLLILGIYSVSQLSQAVI